MANYLFPLTHLLEDLQWNYGLAVSCGWVGECRLNVGGGKREISLLNG